MRGVLACAVMLFHFGLNTLIAKLTGERVHDGRWGLSVDFFFLLSGFVLCHSFLRRPPSLGGYAIKRLFRLAPMFLITTIAVLLAVGRAAWDTPTLAANLAISQSLLGLDSINLVSWSIPFELYFPAVGLLGLGLLRGMASPVRLGLAAVLLAGQAWACWRMAAGHDWPALRAAFGLGLGAIAFLVHGAQPRTPVRFSSAYALAAVTAAVLVMAIAGVAPLAALAFPPLGLIAIWFGVGARGLFSTPPLQALGRWSYSIYLLHIPVLLIANAALGEGRVEGHAALKLALIAGVLALSGLAYRFVEAPLMRLGQRLAGTAGGRPRPAASAAV
jgi:peptidoglycan/LPS O-acetylase OafA/YrhL